VPLPAPAHHEQALSQRSLRTMTAPRQPFVPCPYSLRYVGADRAVPDDRTLACIRFGKGLPAHDDPRVIDVGLAPLGALGAQLWQSELPVRHGRDDGIGYAENGELLFGSLRLEEPELAHMDHAAFRAYVRMDRLLQKFGYPCWLRVWIYMADITHGEGDAERYRQFSLGRHRALSLKPGFELNLPAATAIGSHDSGLVIYFIAAKSPGVQIENPRQVSAFRYPREYGPRSPSFSRAMLKHWSDTTHLYVSGTASIVGHESRHRGDAARQLEEVHNNLQALVQNAQRQLACDPSHTARPLALKLYLRDPGLMHALRPLLPRLFGADTPILCLEGDICREDLLLEMEGLYALPVSAA
jgi:chorismate lyase/3-hydroxybenzoate synthase